MTATTVTETKRALFDRALGLHLSGNAAGARSLYEEVLKQDPKQAHAYHALGVIASQEGRRDEALQWFRQALALRPDEAVFHHNLGRTLHAGREDAAAVVSLRRAVDINPDFVAAWQALAEIHYANDDMDAAAKAIRKVADLQGQAAAKYNEQGVALARESRYKEAVDAFRAGMACNPRGSGIYYNAGVVLAALGQYPDAIACLSQAASLEPKAAPVHVALSNIHHRNGDLDTALRARDVARTLDPRLGEADFEVSTSPVVAPLQPRGSAGQPAQPLTVPVALEKAIAFHQAGNWGAAEWLYRSILAVDPIHADALHLLGVLLHQRGDHRSGLELIDRVIVRGNASAKVHANRAAVLLALGEPDAAETSCRRALEIDPHHRVALENQELSRRGRSAGVMKNSSA